MNEAEPVEGLRRFFEARHRSIEALGVAITLTNGPDDRDPSAAWIDLESPIGTAQLTVWADGQANASFQDFAQEVEPLVEYFEDIRISGVDAAIDLLLTHLTPTSP